MLKLIRSFNIVLLFIGMFSCASRSTSSDVAPMPDREQIAAQIEKSLVKETLEKWYPRCTDELHGGYLTGFARDFSPAGDQRKMIVTQSRHLWVNSKSSIWYPEQRHFLKGADHGFRYLRDVMWDKQYGGFFTLLSRDNQVIDQTKNAYGNAFAIFALAAYYRASGDTSALTLAKQAFHWLEKNSHDPVHKGYFQHLNRDGGVVKRTPGIDSRAETGYKDQNSSIHLLEAFSELYQVWPDPLLKDRLFEMLVLIRDTIVTERGHMTLFFSPEWKPVSFHDSSKAVIEKHRGLDHVSFGHDIETAYLLMEAAHVLGIPDDRATLQTAKRMVDHTLSYGWDDRAGGFYDEGYYFKGDSRLTITRDTKNWWAQAEALNTLLIMADQYPGDEARYFDKFLKQWAYIDAYLIDHEFGDWYAGGLDKEPNQKEAMKGHQWKGTYHQVRSMANCVQRLRARRDK
jgi:cellobiose epimerase